MVKTGSKAQHTGVYKVGPARKVARSRIWLQGKHLTQAGFQPGFNYSALWDSPKGGLTLTLDPQHGKEVEVRTVSGKGDVPIIDITGAKVRDTFTAEFVEVSFYNGRIVIREAE